MNNVGVALNTPYHIWQCGYSDDNRNAHCLLFLAY
jgi:hypothetical protein